MQLRNPVKIVTGTFTVHDSTTSCHQIYRLGLNRLHVSKAVAVNDLTFEQVSHSRQPDVRVWAHLDTFSRRKLRRTKVIEKDKRADHVARSGRQNPAHAETTEIFYIGIYDLQISGCGTGRLGVIGGGHRRVRFIAGPIWYQVCRSQ